MLSGARRTAAIVLAHLGIIYMHGLVIATGEARVQCATGARLFDVVHHLQDQGVWWIAWTLSISNDLMIHLLTIMLVAGMVVHPQRQIILRRFVAFHATIAIIRSVSIWVTTIPSPTDACRDRFMTANVYERAISLTVDAIGLRHEWFGLGAGGNTCCDIIISGHAAILIVAPLLIAMIWRNRWIRRVAWVIATIGLIGSITPDRHYAVEVILTALLGAMLVGLYWYRVQTGPGRFIRWIEEPEVFGSFQPR